MSEAFNEGEAKLVLKLNDVASKELDVFYNPQMKHNRDVSLCVLRRLQSYLQKDEIEVLLPLAGSGVRGVRIQKEVPGTTIRFNDKDDLAVAAIHKHVELNELPDDSYTISQSDATQFMLSQKMGTYIDIDPFGTPNPFLDGAVRMLSRGGVLAVTATDTAPLCGAYVTPCKRKYDAIPHNGGMCQEIGLRILIRKIQLIGAQYDKALIPIFSYPKDHYMRVYFLCKKSKETCDDIQRHHQFLNFPKNDVHFDISDVNSEKFAGPLYTGSLFDKEFCTDSFFTDLAENTTEKKWVDFMTIESQSDIFGYYDLHDLAETERIENIPSMEKVLAKVSEAGFEVIRTAYNLEAVRTNMEYTSFVELLREL